MLVDIDIKHLRRCIELARKALATGKPPFGTLLLNADGAAPDLVDEIHEIHRQFFHPQATE